MTTGSFVAGGARAYGVKVGTRAATGWGANHPRWVLLEYAEPLCPARGLDARVHAQLPVDVRHMGADGLLADEEAGRDLAVGEPVREELEHLDLARGELRA